MSESIKIVPFEQKYQEQVFALHKKEITTSLKVKRLQWIVLFFRSNGVILSVIYLYFLAKFFNFILGIFLTQVHIIISTIIFGALTFFVILPELSKIIAKQIAHYSQSILDNDFEDIKSIYQSSPDKNFWVALDEYNNVCGMIALSNTMPMETEYHLGKYIKDSENIKIGEIKRMTVSSTYRRRGIGTRLTQEHGFRAIVHTTVTLNQSTIALYKKNGFFRISSFFFQVLWKLFGIQVEVYLKLL